MLAEQGHAHHRALQVPARRAPAPRGIPAQHPALAGLLRAPQREVGLAAAAFHVLQPGRLQLPLGAHLGQLAVARVLGGVEVQARGELVGEAVPLKLPGELDHLRHVGAGPRVLVGGQDVQRGGVDEEGVGVEGGDIHHRTPLAGRRDLQLVLAGVGVGDRVPHVGDVHDVLHRDAPPAERAAQRIGEHVRAHVAQVRERVHGRPAAVHAGHFGGGDEVLKPPAQGVVQPQLMVGRHDAPAYRRSRGGGRVLPSPAVRQLPLCRCAAVPLCRSLSAVPLCR